MLKLKHINNNASHTPQPLKTSVQNNIEVNGITHRGINDYSFGDIHIKIPVLPLTVKKQDSFKPKYKSCLICITNTILDDMLFQWIYWHKYIVGFDKIVIADNKSALCLNEICKMFDGVEYFDARLYKNQSDFYNDYLSIYNEAEWVLPIDDDEFLYIPDQYDNKINTYIEKSGINKYSKVSFQWKSMYADNLYNNRPIDVIEYAQYCNPIETELEIGNVIWRSGWVKTLLHADKNTVHYFSDDTSKFMYPSINELINADMLAEPIDETNTSINRNNEIAPDFNGPVFDAIGTVHNPVTLKNNKYSTAFNAYDNKYLFGINADTMHMIKPYVPTILHYKYRSKEEYQWKIDQARFKDISPDYYANVYNIKTIEQRYSFKKYFIKFSNANDLFARYREAYYKLYSKYREELNNYHNTIVNTSYENDTTHPNLKYTVITTIFGDYDILRQPLVYDPDCEYICITDNINLLFNNNTSWKVIVTNDINVLRIDDPRQKTYYVRYHMFDFCNTEYAIWLDASMQIEKSLQPFIKQLAYSDYDIGLQVYTYLFDTMDKNFELWHRIKPEFFDPIIEYTRKWLAKVNYDMSYIGMFVATMRVCKNSDLNKQIDNDVYSLLRAMGEHYYFDEIVYSYIINTKYYDKLKIYPIHGDITVSDYVFAHEHGSTKTRYREKSDMQVYNQNSMPIFLNNKQIPPYKV